MSATAEEFQALGSSLYHWSVYEPECKCELSCTAFHSPNGLVVFDPVPLADDAWKDLLAVAPLRAVILTNGNHIRDADALRKKHRVPVVTTVAARKDLEGLRPDIVLLEHELLYGFAPIPIPGATRGETAYFGHGTMILGDAILNVDSAKGLELLPDKYCVDAKQNRASLHKLLSFDFQTLTFAHGSPLLTQAKAKVTALLDT